MACSNHAFGQDTSLASEKIAGSLSPLATGIGATTGLFVACPTCISTFFALFVGSSSAITFTVILTQLQTLFVGITIPILLLTPIIIAKQMQKKDDDCVFNPSSN